MKTLMTVKEARAAVKKAKRVVIRPRFGLVEKEIIITKKEALYLLEDIADDETPESMEMYGSSFGEDDNGYVRLG